MPKSIDGSVGRGGRNFPAKDVLTVQYLLNCVPAGSGGPQPELVMDGICGPKTLKAIETFQRQNLGFADGRVDRAGRTLQALQQFDPAPNQPLGSEVGGKGGQGKAGGKWGPDPSGKAGGKWGSDPWGKSGGGFGQDPWGKTGGKSGMDPSGKSSGGFGQDPWGKAGGKWGQDPFGKKSGSGGKWG